MGEGTRRGCVVGAGVVHDVPLLTWDEVMMGSKMVPMAL